MCSECVADGVGVEDIDYNIVDSTVRSDTGKNEKYNRELTPCILMDAFIKFDTIDSGWSIVNTKGSRVIVSKFIMFFFL